MRMFLATIWNRRNDDSTRSKSDDHVNEYVTDDYQII